MLPEPGKRKLAATILYTVLCFAAGVGLVHTGKIQGDELVSIVWASGAVVGAFLGANILGAKFNGGGK